jgi:excisionase family DNA binding protein
MPSMPDTPSLLDVRAVAQLLNCSTRHVYRLVERGEAPIPVKVGALVRWQRQIIETWIAGGCKPLGTPLEQDAALAETADEKKG